MGKGHVQADYQLISNSYTFYTGLTLDVLFSFFRVGVRYLLTGKILYIELG